MSDGIFFHYATIAVSVASTCMGAGLSQGWIGATACKAMIIQPAAKDDIGKTTILASALIETISLIGLLIGFLLWLEPIGSFYTSLSQLGIAIALSSCAICVGFASAKAAQQACLAIARQPFMAPRIFRFTLILLSLMQTPLLFSLMVCLFIKSQAQTVDSLGQSLRLIGAGLSMGLGTIGPVIGMGMSAQAAMKGVGINRAAISRLTPLAYISQTIIETPVIFSLIISIFLLVYKTGELSLLSGIFLLSAGLSMGLGTIATGISAGRVARTALEQTTQTPELYTPILNVSLFSQGFIDTNSIYAFILALFMITFL